jgi:hypothetical protein
VFPQRSAQFSILHWSIAAPAADQVPSIEPSLVLVDNMGRN